MTVHKNRSRHQRLPAFRAQHSPVVVNIASLTAEQGYLYHSVYASSKAAVALLSECLNIELAQFGVVVRAILPGDERDADLVGKGSCSSHEEVGR